MKKEWEERLRERIEERGLTMKSVSLKAGLNESFVRDVLRRSRVPSIDKLARLAEALDTTVSELMGDARQLKSSVPLMGYVGAGAEVLPEFEQVPADGLDQIEIPFEIPDEMIAFKVRGDSMLPVFKNGSVIIVYREQKKALESFYGEEAAVRTSDGRRFIKTVMRGRTGVNLFSWNAAPIEDVKLEWIGEIFAVLPALQRSNNR